MYHGIYTTHANWYTTVVPSSPLSFLPPASDGNYRSDMQIATVTANAWLTVTLLTDRYTMSTRRRCTASVIIRARVYFTLVTPPTSHPQSSSTRFVPTPWRKFGFIGGERWKERKRKKKEKRKEWNLWYLMHRVCRKRDIFRAVGERTRSGGSRGTNTGFDLFIRVAIARDTNGLIYRGLNLNVYDFDKICR